MKSLPLFLNYVCVMTMIYMYICVFSMLKNETMECTFYKDIRCTYDSGYNNVCQTQRYIK